MPQRLRYIKMIRAIITGLLSTTALLGSVSAFGDGPPCQGMDMVGPGNCVKKSDTIIKSSATS